MERVPILAVRDLDYVLPDGRVLLENVDLDLEEGGFFVAKGPSGAGKSTLLRLLCRLITPSAGAIFLRGRDVADTPPPEYRTKVLYLHQTPIMAEGTVADNILLPFAYKANSGSRPPDRRRLQDLMREFGMEEVGLDQPAGRLSVGQKQRICLMRGLVLQPDVLLLDEPTSALDPENAGVVMDRAVWLNRERGQTIIMVTHAAQEIPADNARTIRVENRTAALL